MNLINQKPKFNIGDVVFEKDTDGVSHAPYVITSVSAYVYYDEITWYYGASNDFHGQGKPEEFGEDDLVLADEIPDDVKWYIKRYLEFE